MLERSSARARRSPVKFRWWRRQWASTPLTEFHSFWLVLHKAESISIFWIGFNFFWPELVVVLIIKNFIIPLENKVVIVRARNITCRNLQPVNSSAFNSTIDSTTERRKHITCPKKKQIFRTSMEFSIHWCHWTPCILPLGEERTHLISFDVNIVSDPFSTVDSLP